MPCKTGAAEAIANCRVVVAGVRGIPLVVVKLGANMTVSATVPVWMKICDPCPTKFALVLPAGMVKSTVRLPAELPVENCTAGSVPKFPDVVRVSTPLRSTG